MFYQTTRMKNQLTKQNQSIQQEWFRFLLNRVFVFLCIVAIGSQAAASDTDKRATRIKGKSVSESLMAEAGNPAQPRTVTGRVTDSESGEALIGVNIMIEGTTTGVITDFNGNYNLTAPGTESVLVFSYIGYNTERIVVGNRNLINVNLVMETSELDEVVVIGYGTQRKLTVTGAIGNIEADEIIKSPTSSINNALAGRAAGVMTIQSTSEPGRDFAEIFIRGRATTGNTQPLILVDGIERDITRLDPNEVESINVLKDASATAVFGVRGANGVIVVTTKTGHLATKPTISFSYNYGLQGYNRVPRSLPAVEFMKNYNYGAYTDATNKATFTPYFTGENFEMWRSGVDPIFHPDVDWFDFMLSETVPTKQSNLNIQGGTKRAKYFVSLGYYNAVGFFEAANIIDDWEVNSQTKRYNIRVNTDFQWTKKFSTSVKFSTSISDGNFPRNTGDLNEVLNNMFASAPIVGQPAIDGKYIASTKGLEAFKTVDTSPFNLFYGNGFRLDYNSRTNIDLTTKYDLDVLTEGLSIRGKFAYDNYYSQTAVRYRQIDRFQVIRTAPGYEGDYYALIPTEFSAPWNTQSEDFGQTARMYSEAALDYGRTLAGGHTVGGLFLGTMERSFRGGNPALPYNYMGLVARVTYNYKRKYMGEVNMGYNGSENFKRGNQFGFFPSFSLGYVISEENFFPKNNVFTFLKVRGSYGLVGNDNIGGGRFQYTPSVFAPSNNAYWFGGTNRVGTAGFNELAIGNPLISWEVAEKTNIGLETKFFKDKLSLSGDIFKETRSGIYGKYNNVSYTFGDIDKLPSFNLGQVENKGFEIESAFRNSVGNDFSYNISGNFTYAKNKRVYFDEIPPAYPNLIETGLPIGQPFMLQADGFYTSWDEINDPNRILSIWETASPLQPGDLKYVDINGDGIIDTNDRIPYGYSNVPEIFYGMTTGLRYKNFDITVLIQGAAHVQTSRGTRPFIGPGFGGVTDGVYEQWTMERYLSGDDIKYPRASIAGGALHSWQSNTQLVESASYIRIKNVEFGYNFDRGFLRKLGMSSMRPYISGQNLFTYSPLRHWDPESLRASGGNFRYPVSRILNFGVRANF